MSKKSNKKKKVLLFLKHCVFIYNTEKNLNIL